ncbi:MAG: hypothetical protein U0790_08095 [Isosphaeraceae bacterium]
MGRWLTILIRSSRADRPAAGVPLLLALLMAAAAGGQEPPGRSQDGAADVLTRGPVHEAFAAPVVHDPQPGLVVPKEPPAAVEELPPDQKPSGQNVQWIAGYWSWDPSREDFIWISGVWREPPPGRQWVPGYWNRVEGGFQWIPGAWVPVGRSAGGAAAEPASEGQAAYLPAPPRTLEQGPNSPQPEGNVFWTPGCWSWQEGRYLWRPGFWAAVQPNWLWIPAHYVWTPGGFLFVEGYWDLPLATRGVLFAPVYFTQPVYLQPSYVFTPSLTIATPGLVANLFVIPSYQHYCFGDYYDRSFLSVGIVPWFSFTYVSGPARPVYYDPIFTFYASVNIRRDPGWVARVRQEYVVRRDNVAMRPPRTYIEQTRIVQRNVNITRNVTVLARPLAERTPEGGSRLERVSLENRRHWQDQGAELRRLREARSRQEAQAVGWRPNRPEPGERLARAEPSARPRPLRLPASPVAAPLHQHAEGPASAGRLPRPDHAAAGPPQRRLGDLHRDAPSPVDPRRPATPGPSASASRQQPADRPAVPRHSGTPGQAAPHDVPGAATIPRTSRPGQPSPPSGEASRLHAPPRYTHRQPPPAPRPLPRRGQNQQPRPKP